MKVINYLAFLVPLITIIVLKEQIRSGMFFAVVVPVAILVGYAVFYLIIERKKKRG